MSGSEIKLPLPRVLSNSARIFFWISGLFTNSATPHSIDHKVVSIAAVAEHENVHMKMSKRWECTGGGGGTSDSCMHYIDNNYSTKSMRSIWKGTLTGNHWERGRERERDVHTCNIDILHNVKDIVFVDLSFALCIKNMVHSTLLRLCLWAQNTQHLPACASFKEWRVRVQQNFRENMKFQSACTYLLEIRALKTINKLTSKIIRYWQQQTLGLKILSLLALIKEEFLEQSQSSILDLLTDLQVALEEWAKDGNEVTIVVLKTLCKSAPLSIESLELHIQGVIFTFKSGIKHQPVHVVVHHELQPPANHHSCGRCFGHCLQIFDHMVCLILPCKAWALDHLVGEEGNCHDSPHPSPMLPIDCEHHVLTISSKDIKDHIAGARSKLNSLCVKHFLGQIRGGNHHQVPLSHPQHEHIPMLLCQFRQIPVV